MSAKVAPTKRTAGASRRHYHLSQRQHRDSWDGWVGDRRSRFRRLEWFFHLFVVAAVFGLIVWQAE